MKRILSLFITLLFFGCQQDSKYIRSNTVQLATPLIKSASLFASEFNQIEAPFLNASQNLEVNYLEGNEKEIYTSKENIVLNQIGTYQIRTIAPPFLPSEWVALEVLPKGKTISSISWETNPKPKYFKGGSSVLIDGKSAEISFHSKGWTGSNTPFQLRIYLDNVTYIDSLTLGVLSNPSAWIYPTSELQIKIQNENSKVIVKEFVIQVDGNLNAQKHAFISFDIGEEVNELQLDFIPKNLPEEHPGAGTPAWFFLDELILY